MRFTRPPGSGSLRLLPSSGRSQHESARYKSAQIYILFLKSPSYGLRFLRVRTLSRNAEHVGNTRCQHGSARFSFGRSRSAAVSGGVRYAENRTAGLHLLRRIPVRRRPYLHPTAGQASRSRNLYLMPNRSKRPTYREVTACGGTFPDTAT